MADSHLGRVVSILEGESLINDATTITLFVMISSILTIPGYDLNWIEIAGRFIWYLPAACSWVFFWAGFSTRSSDL